MADSTTNIDNIVQSQSAKEVTANAFFDAASQAATYGRRQSTCSGLTWGFYGGNIVLNTGAGTVIANGTVTLAASTTNYVVAHKITGVVSVNTTTTNWDDRQGYWRLYSIVTGASSVTSYTDIRRGWWNQVEPVFFLPASVVPAVNAQMAFELTDNTTLTIKVKGTDGIVRSATITLT